MVGQAKDGRAGRRLVAADALEDARPVVQAVGADVDRRLIPVDELAVHPDVRGRLHGGVAYRGASEGGSGPAPTNPASRAGQDPPLQTRASEGGSRPLGPGPRAGQDPPLRIRRGRS